MIVINRKRFIIGLSVIALAIVYLVFWPKEYRLFCPIHALTGFWCPGCGSTRALDSLLRADFPSAVRNNALLLASPLLALVGIKLQEKNFRLLVLYLSALLLLVVIFTIGRNLPGSIFAPIG